MMWGCLLFCSDTRCRDAPLLFYAQKQGKCAKMQLKKGVSLVCGQKVDKVKNKNPCKSTTYRDFLQRGWEINLFFKGVDKGNKKHNKRYKALIISIVMIISQNWIVVLIFCYFPLFQGVWTRCGQGVDNMKTPVNRGFY